MPIPIDFEKLAKLPPGNGYPNSIRAEDLMKNFAWCDLLPSDSGDALRVEFVEQSGETARHPQRRISIVGQAGALHDWRISAGTTPGTYNVTGGIVRGNGGSATATDVSAVSLIDGDQIWLEVTRDATSRAVNGATIATGAAMPASSTSTTQYVLIGSISGGQPVQSLFEETNFEELMVVYNGEFQLLPIKAAARNTYDVPT